MSRNRKLVFLLFLVVIRGFTITFGTRGCNLHLIQNLVAVLRVYLHKQHLCFVPNVPWCGLTFMKRHPWDWKQLFGELRCSTSLCSRSRERGYLVCERACVLPSAIVWGRIGKVSGCRCPPCWSVGCSTSTPCHQSLSTHCPPCHVIKESRWEICLFPKECDVLQPPCQTGCNYGGVFPPLGRWTCYSLASHCKNLRLVSFMKFHSSHTH